MSPELWVLVAGIVAALLVMWGYAMGRTDGRIQGQHEGWRDCDQYHAAELERTLARILGAEIREEA